MGRIRQALHQVRSLHRRLSDLHLLVHAGSLYTENGQAGERRRVQASCMIDGYTEVAGGLCFRKNAGERMRFKVLHKVLDFKKRSGFQMCVGCGRCDAICPEYISFTHCVEKLEAGMKEVSGHE